jgi:hypothetical protein
MRTDAIGLFWQDLPPPPKVKKEKIKRTPPERTWERPDYLPGLEVALRAVYNRYSQEELVKAVKNGEPHVFDIECYPNYFLIAFRNILTQKVIYFEKYLGCELNVEWLSWVAHNVLLISYNGLGYDEPILTLALAGATNAELKEASDRIITEDWRPSDILKNAELERLKLNHIDVMEVAPAGGSLKQRAGRLHRKRLQDLPFPPNMMLTRNHMVIVLHYCINDLDATEALYLSLQDEIHLREIMSQEYGVDLRSRSDAQIAEDVIRHEIQRITRKRVQRAKVEPGRRYKYNVPRFLVYQTPLMNSVIDLIKKCDFVISEKGSVELPWQLKNLRINIGNASYQMGIGGLHSTEEKACHHYVKGRKKRDIDVTSYYPSVILGQRLFPEHLGEVFLRVYKKIVDRRVRAKHTGDKKTAQTLKIVINGSFGKLGSMWSVLYAPQLLIQVTITGQLSLLMLIEAFELMGIPVISANTDGIVIDYPEEQEPLVEQIIKWWEKQTGFEMESNFYRALYSANVNNYVAIDDKGKLKCKGWFADSGLSKNPSGEIIIEAVRAKLKDNIPVEETITKCKDIRKFAVVRAVKGGAVCNGDYLGKVVRWYYGPEDYPEMVYAASGNKVTNSAGGVPMMELPDEFPENLNHDVYIAKANKYLEMMGYQ